MTVEKSVKLIADRPQVYRGRFVRVGESFSAAAGDAADLIAIKYASPDLRSSRADYKQRGLNAEIVDAEDGDDTGKASGYLRRDMRAKE